jgi:hypothetical protein
MRSTLLRLVVACAAVGTAQARGRLADVTVIDRDTGAALETYYSHDEYWVAGRPGARYSIELHNRTGERLLAVMSVDGVNVVSGETAGFNQIGYVLAPYTECQITGWRKSDSMVAAFGFTTAQTSYAEKTGRPENIGVIGVALFREQPAPTEAETPPISQATPHRDESSAGRLAAQAPPATSDQAAESLADASRGEDGVVTGQRIRPGPRPVPLPAPAPSLGTGHGEREVSYTWHTTFTRLHAYPDEVVRVRYDSRENLIAMGIIHRPRMHPSRSPQPFPGTEESYVPDPPSG